MDARTWKEARESIVRHLRDRVDAEKKPIPIQTFMKDVHEQHYKWKKYWGDDCKSLLTTLGLNMNVEQLVVPTNIGTFRKVLCGDLLPNVLKFLFGETITSYRKRILNPKYGRGDYPELVAAGQIWKRHIVVMQPAPSQLEMTQTRFILPNRPISQRNTTYLVRVNNNHYHACDFRKDLQVDTTARLLLPSGFYVEEMKRDYNCMFRALAHLWKRDSELHGKVRDAIVHHIFCSWSQPWWRIQCSKAFPEEMNGRYDISAMLTYKQSMMPPFRGQGDIPELVAAGRVIGCHIKVMVHHLVTDGFLSTILITIDGLEVRRDNTLHLLRVADRHFHALELASLDESPVEPSTSVQGPSDSSWCHRFDKNSNNIQQTITVQGQGEASVIGSSTCMDSKSSKKAKWSAE